MSPKLIWSFQVILVYFGEVAAGVSPGLKSGIGFYVGIGVGVCHQVPVPTVSQDLRILPMQDPRGGGVTRQEAFLPVQQPVTCRSHGKSRND